MRFQGVLTAWNAQAGYGSIRPVGGGGEVFVTLAAFPSDGEGARLDELLSFEIVTGRDGRKQAANLKRLPAAQVPTALREASGTGRLRMRQSQRRRRLGMAAGAIVAVMLTVGGVRLWQPDTPGSELTAGMRR
jgi:cold shock CspA family protein